MTRPRKGGWRRRAGNGALLALALLFVMLVTYVPHMQTLERQVNPTGAAQGDEPTTGPYYRLAAAYWSVGNGSRDDYEHPMHVDEDVHWVRMAAIQREDTLRHADPYTGAPQTADPVSFKGFVHERGFHVAFAQFQELTGLPFILIIRFFPALFAAVTATLVWASLRPWAGAPLAAAFVALVPTSPRFLGIGFFVPAGIGLAWLAAALLLVRWSRTRATLALTLLLAVWSFFIHLIIGFAFLLVLVAAAPAVFKERRGDILRTGGIAIVVLTFLYAAFRSDFRREAEVLGFLPADFTIFDQIGLPFLVAWGIGCALLVYRPPSKEIHAPLVAAGIGSVVALVLIVVNFAFDLRLYSLYDRWHQPFALLATLPAAYAVVRVVQWVGVRSMRVAEGRMTLDARSRRQLAWALPAAGALVVVGLGAAVAAPGLDAHLEEPYYYFMTDEVWARFLAARAIDDAHEVYLVHPWQAPIFNALTGKRPFVWLDPGTPPARGAEYFEYHTSRQGDEVWLVERDISILFDVPGPTGPHFRQGPGGVYLLDDHYANELHNINELNG